MANIPPGISLASVGPIPSEWSAQWFRQFIAQWLQNLDTRNAIAGAGISITGNIHTPATIAASAITGPPFSVYGNPTGTLTQNTSIAATVAGQVLNFNGTALQFSTLSLSNGGALGNSFSVTGLTSGTVLQAGVNGNTAAFSAVQFPTLVAAGDILVGVSQNQVGSLPIGTPGQVLIVSGSTNPAWQSTISATITTAALTGGGTQGSMTFVNGLLTAQTPAT